MKQEYVIINQDSGYLMIDIANVLAAENRHCTLIAGRLVQRNKPLDPKIKIRKIIRYDRSRTIKRLFTWGIAFLQIIFLILFHHRSSKLFILSNPPFAPLLPLFCSNKFSLLIFDVYPDAPSEFGIISERSWIVKLWKKANCVVFRKADRIYTITDGMKEVLKKYADNKEIEVIPLWTDNNFLKPIPKESNPFLKQHRLENKFVVLYSGNLGYAHNVETIIELAARINNPDILFLIIGDGEKKWLVQEKIKFHGLTNFKMLPFQKTAVLPFSLSIADLAIVSLGKEASRLSVPSKIYDLMSVGAPLLCIANKDSELAKIVEINDIGKCFSNDRVDDMKNFICEMFNNPQELKRYKNNALSASRKYTFKNAERFL